MKQENAGTFSIPETKITLESMTQAAIRAEKIKPFLQCESNNEGEVGAMEYQSSGENQCCFTSIGKRKEQQDRAFFEAITSEGYSPEIIGQALFNTGIEIGIHTLKNGFKGGSTATFCYVQDKHVVSLQVGDSAAFLISIQNGKIETKRLTEIHSPHTESQRIKNAGGIIRNGRISPLNINVSRSFGDFIMYTDGQKSVVLNSKGFTFEPVISYTEINPDCENYLLLCTDGISDFLTPQDIQAKLFDVDNAKKSLTDISKELHVLAADHGSEDNKITLLKKLDPKKKESFLYGVCDGHGEVETALQVCGLYPNILKKILPQRPENFPGVSLKHVEDQVVMEYWETYLPTSLNSSFASLPESDTSDDSKDFPSANSLGK